MSILKNKYYLQFEMFFVLSPIICLFLGVFNTPSAKHLLSRLLVVVTIYCAFRYDGWRNKFNNKVFKYFFFSSLALAGYFILLHFTQNYDISFSRTIIPVLLYLLFIPSEFIHKQKIFFIVLLSGVIAGGGAYYEYFFLSLRAGTTVINAIPFATYAAIIFFTSIFLAKDVLLQLKVYKKSYYVFFSVSLILCFSAIILSMTRGIWLATVFVIIIFMVANIKTLFKRKCNFLWLLIIITLAFSASFEMISARVTATQLEFKNISANNQNSSIGIRLQLYKTGLKHFITSPIFGISYEKDIQLSTEDLKEGNITAVVYPFLKINHYHNQFIYQLVYTGIFGLCLFLLYMFTLPFILRNKHGALRNVVVSVILVIIIAGITDIPFRHAHITYLFSMLMGILIISDGNSIEKRHDER